MDVISDVLKVLNFKGCLYFTTRFKGDWGIRVPSYQRVARFHMVVGGSCWVKLEGMPEAELLEPGDMIVIPHGLSHTLSYPLDTYIHDLEDAIQASGFMGRGVFEFGQHKNGDETKLICGHLEYDTWLDHPLIEQLPTFLSLKGTKAKEFAWFHQAALLMACEAKSDRPGHIPIAQRMSEILFIHALRTWNEENSHNTGFLAALTDRGLGRCLQVIHEQFSRKWNLHDLARVAGLSRSSFAEKFRDRLGVTPMQYLTAWRILKAKRLLVDEEEAIELIAERVGYESLSAFSRVFKKLVGLGPGRFRKNQRLLEN